MFSRSNSDDAVEARAHAAANAPDRDRIVGVRHEAASTRDSFVREVRDGENGSRATDDDASTSGDARDGGGEGSEEAGNVNGRSGRERGQSEGANAGRMALNARRPSRDHERTPNKFMPWLSNTPTLDGTLEKRQETEGWWASLFGGGTQQWGLRYFLLYDTHLFWGKGFSTMHGYGTVLSVREVPELGPTSFAVEMMAVPKRNLRRSFNDNVNFLDLISGLCCTPAGFRVMYLRATSPKEMQRWMEGFCRGTSDTPVSTRMPLDFSEEIPPSPRISTDSELSMDTFSGTGTRTRYEEPPPPLSPGGASREFLNASPETEDVPLFRLDANGESGEFNHSTQQKSPVRTRSVLKSNSMLRNHEQRQSIDGNCSKSVTFDDHVESVVIARSPVKQQGIVPAQETDREFRTRTRLLKAAGCFKISESELQIGAKLGIGSFGVVYRAKWNDTDVAYKVMLQDKMNYETVNAFAEEIRMMRGLRHPNIVLFIGAVIQPNRLGIVSELMKRGNLEFLLHGNSTMGRQLRENGMLRRQMAADCARGMLYLHSLSRPVVHHDLKPANLVVDSNWTLKVSDFGMAQLKSYTYDSVSGAPGGTPEWMSPEALRGDEANERSDIYSFGVILWELMTVSFPWAELSSPVQIVAQVAFLHRRLKVPEWIEKPMADLLHSCWAREPEERPTFEKIVEQLAGEYPQAWSLGQVDKSADEQAANILAMMSTGKGASSTEADSEDSSNEEEFVDNVVEVSVISAFAPRGLKPIRTPTPTPVTDVPKQTDTLDTEEDSTEESNSLDAPNGRASASANGTVMTTVNEFRLRLSPLKTPRAELPSALPTLSNGARD